MKKPLSELLQHVDVSLTIEGELFLNEWGILLETKKGYAIGWEIGSCPATESLPKVQDQSFIQS